MNLLVRYFRFNKLYLFIILVSANAIMLWLSKNLLINEIILSNSYSEQLTYERSLELMTAIKKYSWIGYLAMPISFSLKFILISGVIYIGVYFCELCEKISFRAVFGVVVASEIVFLTASVLKISWIYFFWGNYNMSYIKFFYPLSLANFFNEADVDKLWIFPMQSLNLFQIFYILILSVGLEVQSGIVRSKTEKIVLISYLPGYLIWLTLVMFLTIGTLS